MFNNLINKYDMLRVFEKLAEGRLPSLLDKFFRRRRERVRRTWQHTVGTRAHWWNIPAVRARLNRLVSGDEEIDHRTYLVEKYLAPRAKGLKALSLGCGAGQNEIAWAQKGIFSRIDAYDISPSRIRHATAESQKEGLSDILHFMTADAQDLVLKDAYYDLVIFEGSLHHFYPVKDILSRVGRSLAPDGLLVVVDFVGPSRFQWLPRQLEAANGLLALLPPHLRRNGDTGRLKKKIYAPGRLRMRLSDPSEAADSAAILPCLAELFETIELKKRGGTLLQLLLNDIADHFCDNDPLAAQLLDLCFETEDILMAANDIASDFVLAVCCPKPQFQ